MTFPWFKKTYSFAYKRNRYNQYLPIVDITLVNGDMAVRTTALVDSGATISVFASELSQLLKINLSAGQKVPLSGVGGKVDGYQHKLLLQFAGKNLSLPVIFAENLQTSVNLLGRKGFFENFIVSFNESKQYLSLT